MTADAIELPTTSKEFREVIDALVDPALFEQVTQAQDALQEAEQALADCQAELADHQSARPTQSAAVQAWVVRKQTLEGALPLHQEIAEQRRHAVTGAREQVKRARKEASIPFSRQITTMRTGAEQARRAEVDALTRRLRELESTLLTPIEAQARQLQQALAGAL